MRVHIIFQVSFVLLCLLAIGMQCQEGSRGRRRSRQRDRRMRRLRLRGRRTTTTQFPIADQESTNRESIESDANNNLPRLGNSSHLMVGLGAQTDIRSLITDRQVLMPSGEGNESFASRLEAYVREIEANEPPPEETPQTVVLSPTASDDNEEDPDEQWDWWRRRERARQARLFMFQAELLHRLGFKQQPNVITQQLSDAQKDHIAQVYEQRFQEEEEEEVAAVEDANYYAKRLRSYLPSCALPRRADDTWRENMQLRLLFDPDIPDDLNHTVLSAATLRLYKKPIMGTLSTVRAETESEGAEDNTDRFVIAVHKYLRPVRQGRRERRSLVTSVVVQQAFAGWVKLDLRAAVEHWYSHPNRNFGILVTVKLLNGSVVPTSEVFDLLNCDSRDAGLPLQMLLLNNFNESAESDTSESSDSGMLPYLNIMTVEQLTEVQERRRRSTPTVDAHECNLINTTLHFGGSGEIITPKYLTIGVCIGNCVESQGTVQCCYPSRTRRVSVRVRGRRGDIYRVPLYTPTQCSHMMRDSDVI